MSKSQSHGVQMKSHGVQVKSHGVQAKSHGVQGRVTVVTAVFTSGLIGFSETMSC